MTTGAKKLSELTLTWKGSSGLQERQNRHSLKHSDIAIREKYGDALKFTITFNPDLQSACAANVEKSIMGEAPRIASLCSAYDKEQIRVWILAQIENLNTYAGTLNKMNRFQMEMLSDIILTEYYYLKASELLLFFFQFKAGKYGELYGSVDPLRVASALVEFSEYRRKMIFEFESKQKAEERMIAESEREKKAITRQQYLRLKFARSTRKWTKKKSDRK